MLVGIHHTALSTPDVDRAVAFYRDLFGFEVAFDFAWDEGNRAFQRTHAAPETRGRVVMLERAGARLEVFEYAKPVPRQQPDPAGNADHGICHFAFEVKQIEAEVERLRRAGMRFLSDPVPQAYVKCCYGRDPDGNLIELIEYFDHDVEHPAQRSEGGSP
jgi:catechol 2,3-dioxygenase-like lactoylglutathione lyase family enzyme